MSTTPRPTRLATLVATDGSEAAQRGIRVAAALEAAGLVAPAAVAVDPIELTAMTGTRLDPAKAVEAWLGPEAINAWRLAIQTDLRAAGGGDWPIRLRGGVSVPDAVAREVHARHCDLVIVGLRHRGTLAQVTRRDTAWRIIEQVGTPVLAVAPGLDRVPHHIVVGIDFSRASERAAKMAARLLDAGGTLTLLHAESQPGRPTEDTEGYARINDEGCDALLNKLSRDITLPEGAHLETLRSIGAPIDVLRETAKRLDADVIAVGRQHHAPFTRAVLGSVSAELVHDGRWSVLVTPLAETPPA
ncbi:MAG TPA: universal stress protein [Gemmatimonadaceae bacterium]|nr:universal stress protein [Gemmatimonadaceae bacterium]